MCAVNTAWGEDATRRSCMSESTGHNSDSPARSDLEYEPPKNPTASRQNGLVVRMACTLTAGLLTWLIVQAVHPLFATEIGRDEVGFLPVDVQWRLDRNNAMFVLALLGGLSGIGLAVGTCARRDTWLAVSIAAAKCGAVGTVCGALAGYLGHRTFEFYKMNAEVSDL